jgi:hypothetical protein
MKVATKQIIESILTEELKEYVNPYEINNTISKMDNGFDSGSTINKTKLADATNLGIKYLNSICLPTHVIATQAIYKNKVLIALGKVESAF